MHTLVDISEEQIKVLDAIAKAKKLSRAELISQAIAVYVEWNKPLIEGNKRGVFLDAFGCWKDKDIDGLEYQQKIRAEWDR
jgi:predicted transcriptional regulator